MWWYCRNEEVTIQFLRSEHRPGDPWVSDGRLAITTTQRGEQSEPGRKPSAVERRYLALKRHIQKTYTNKVVIWQNLSMPRSKTNPSKPDVSLWVGPNALHWLEHDPENRRVQQFPQSVARGYLLELGALTIGMPFLSLSQSELCQYPACAIVAALHPTPMRNSRNSELMCSSQRCTR